MKVVFSVVRATLELNRLMERYAYEAQRARRVTPKVTASLLLSFVPNTCIKRKTSLNHRLSWPARWCRVGAREGHAPVQRRLTRCDFAANSEVTKVELRGFEPS